MSETGWSWSRSQTVCWRGDDKDKGFWLFVRKTTVISERALVGQSSSGWAGVSALTWWKSATTPITVCQGSGGPLVATRRMWLPIGFCLGQNWRASASLMMTTFGGLVSD